MQKSPFMKKVYCFYRVVSSFITFPELYEETDQFIPRENSGSSNGPPPVLPSRKEPEPEPEEEFDEPDDYVLPEVTTKPSPTCLIFGVCSAD